MATLISTPSELDAIRNDLSGKYELANDIDMSGWGNWDIILNFNGTIDGKGFRILNLTIDKFDNGESDSIAFMRNTESNNSYTIKNLGFENIYYNNTNISYRSGGITGYSYNATIENCYVTGEIISDVHTGGIGGLMRGNSSIKNCWTDVTIQSDGGWLSGIVSHIIDDFPVENTYAIGQLSGDGSYKYGISRTEGTNASNNFYNTETTGTTNSGIGIGKTTAEMQDESTYAGWNFTDVWGINGDYPYLQAFGTPEQPAKQESRDITSNINSINTNVDTTINNYIPPKIETRLVNSNISTIQSSVSHFRASKRVNISYINKLNTNATQSSQTVREGIATTYISPISTNVSITTYKQPKLHTVNLMAYTKPILANTDVLIPIEDKMIYGITSIVSNRTDAYINVNKTTTQVINNPSNSEVME